MQTDSGLDQPRTVPSSDREMLDEARRRLVRIHTSIAERTNRELPEIMPWALDQLMGLIREIRAYEQEHPTDAI